MKLETKKHFQRIVSLLSESMAEHFKDKISSSQFEILKHNVYTLEKEDVVYDKYRGCGCGWVEIDTNGKAIDLQYLDEGVVDWREDLDDEGYEMRIGIVPSQEAQALYLNTRQKEQNADMLEFHTEQLMPMVLPNGNMRILVNFSSCQLVRF